jgi:ACS family tartrate transporter-like MFS transporter
VVLGGVVLVFLTDRPEHATWLEPEQRAWLAERLAGERTATARRHGASLGRALVHPRVWSLGLLYFVLVLGIYGVSLWLPQMIAARVPTNELGVGILAAIPYAVAAVAMVLVGRHSDRSRERRWHIALSALAGAAGLATSALVEAPVLGVLGLCVAALGIWSSLGPFWTLPTAFLSGTAAAGGIALVNSVGNLGGFVGPSVLGLLKDATGDFRAGLLFLALGLAAAAALALRMPREDD